SDFIVSHTYPPVIILQNWPYNNAPDSGASCVGEILASETKQLGQDILDLDFSLADSLLYNLNKVSCRAGTEDVLRERFESGLLQDPSDMASTVPVTQTARSGQRNTNQTIFALAKEQAFKEIDLTDAAFASLCEMILGMGDDNESSSEQTSSRPTPSRKEIFRNFIDNLKICGLKDLLGESINCLLAGIPFEKAMASIVKAAIENMSLVNFGRFIDFLPADDQEQIRSLVRAKLESGEFFKEGSVNEKLSNYIANGNSSEEVVDIEPWGDEKLIERIGNKTTVNSQSNLNSTGSKNESSKSMLQRYRAQSNSLDRSTTVVMELYVQAVLQHFEQDFFSVLEVLNRFPGSQLISKAVLLADCPQPPLFSPSVMNFIRDIELPFCRGIGDITLPSMRNPLGWIPKLNDITGAVSAQLNFKIQEILISILSRLLVKVCNLIGASTCQLLKTTGQLVTTLGSYNNRDEIASVIRESFCGPDASDSQVENTIIDIFEKLGLGAAALADTEKLLQFTGDLASSLTRKEMIDMFLGNPSAESLRVTYELVEQEYPEYEDALPSEEAIADLMSNIGNLMPADHRNEMSKFVDDLGEDDYYPANPQLCASPEDIENFRAFRCGQLAERVTGEQCRIMNENYQNDLIDKLDD
ncbi:MAG TPA: hypothetical protein DCM40_32595, partial [Maribacter sp.]|nr:hypothetical protein [Maribacter sp.]